MGRKGMSTALARTWPDSFGKVGSSGSSFWWIWVLPAIAPARRGIFLTAGVDGKLLQLLLNRPPTDSLLPLLKHLHVALLPLPLTLTVIALLIVQDGVCHPSVRLKI